MCLFCVCVLRWPPCVRKRFAEFLSKIESRDSCESIVKQLDMDGQRAGVPWVTECATAWVTHTVSEAIAAKQFSVPFGILKGTMESSIEKSVIRAIPKTTMLTVRKEIHSQIATEFFASVSEWSTLFETEAKKNQRLVAIESPKGVNLLCNAIKRSFQINEECTSEWEFQNKAPKQETVLMALAILADEINECAITQSDEDIATTHRQWVVCQSMCEVSVEWSPIFNAFPVSGIEARSDEANRKARRDEENKTFDKMVQSVCKQVISPQDLTKAIAIFVSEAYAAPEMTNEERRKSCTKAARHLNITNMAKGKDRCFYVVSLRFILRSMRFR